MIYKLAILCSSIAAAAKSGCRPAVPAGGSTPVVAPAPAPAPVVDANADPTDTTTVITPVVEMAPQMSLKVFHMKSRKAQHPYISQTVPADYKIISGGAKSEYTGTKGQLLTASYPKSATEWFAKSKDHKELDLGFVTAYAVAIHDPNDEWDVKIVTAQSVEGTTVSATATLPEGYVLTGGGAFDDFKEPGHLLFESYPYSSNSWKASGRTVSYTTAVGKVTTYVIGIKHKTKETRTGCSIKSAQSSKVAHPKQFLSVSSDSVLVGGGGRVSQTDGAHGNVLTAIYPDGTGFTASGKDHLESDHQQVTTYGIVCPKEVASF